jgi:hypothetical protein
MPESDIKVSTFISNIPLKKETIAPQPQFWKGGNKSSSHVMPSEIRCWWDRENQRRRESLLNEIDQNEIKAAKKGTFNVWHSIIQKYPDHFKDADIEKDEWNWEIIIKLKKELR